MIDLVVSSSFTAFFRSIDHKILVRAWLPSPYIVVHSFEKGCKRAFKAIIKRRPDLKPKIEAKLRLLATDPYNPILRTHKLKGKLSGAWACSVEYDCRIVFSFGQNQETEEEEIILIDIGTHNEVY
jgi:addiction module RelE/StbE family toxin